MQSIAAWISRILRSTLGRLCTYVTHMVIWDMLKWQYHTGLLLCRMCVFGNRNSCSEDHLTLQHCCGLQLKYACWILSCCVPSCRGDTVHWLIDWLIVCPPCCRTTNLLKWRVIPHWIVRSQNRYVLVCTHVRMCLCNYVHNSVHLCWFGLFW